jgi:hypothetical protein
MATGTPLTHAFFCAEYPLLSEDEAQEVRICYVLDELGSITLWDKNRHTSFNKARRAKQTKNEDRCATHPPTVPVDATGADTHKYIARCSLMAAGARTVRPSASGKPPRTN